MSWVFWTSWLSTSKSWLSNAHYPTAGPWVLEMSPLGSWTAKWVRVGGRSFPHEDFGVPLALRNLTLPESMAGQSEGEGNVPSSWPQLVVCFGFLVLLQVLQVSRKQETLRLGSNMRQLLHWGTHTWRGSRFLWWVWIEYQIHILVVEQKKVIQIWWFISFTLDPHLRSWVLWACNSLQSYASSLLGSKSPLHHNATLNLVASQDTQTLKWKIIRLSTMCMKHVESNRNQKRNNPSKILQNKFDT